MAEATSKGHKLAVAADCGVGRLLGFNRVRADSHDAARKRQRGIRIGLLLHVAAA